LLAAELAFTDPLTGEPHRFRSHRPLAAWSAVDDQPSDISISEATRVRRNVVRC